MTFLCESLNRFPVMAVLRGINPDCILEVGQMMVDLGYRAVEVPYSDTDAPICIEILSNMFGDKMHIAGGDVYSFDDVNAVTSVGATMMVSPIWNKALSVHGLSRQLLTVSSVATADELREAVQAGVKYLALRADGGNCFRYSLDNAFLRSQGVRVFASIDAEEAISGGFERLGCDGLRVVFNCSNGALKTKELINQASTLISLFMTWKCS